MGLFGGVGKAVGGFVADQLNQISNPQLPSDLVVGDDIVIGKTQTESGLYTRLIKGSVNNQKGVLGNILSGYATKTQFTQNISPAIVGAATNLAIQGIGALAGKIGAGATATSLATPKLENNITK